MEERAGCAQGTTTDTIVRNVHQRQAAMSVTVRNIITSMRLISAVDWTELVESVSLVDAVLRQGSDFATQDFTTRDRNRRAIEEIGARVGLTELDVPREALPVCASTAAGTAEADSPQRPRLLFDRYGTGGVRGHSDFERRGCVFRSAVGTAQRACAAILQVSVCLLRCSSCWRCPDWRSAGLAGGRWRACGAGGAACWRSRRRRF